MAIPNKQIDELNRQQEEFLAKQRAEKYDLPYLDLAMSPIQYNALMLVDEDVARKAEVAVIHKGKGGISLAVKNPEAPETKKVLKELENTNYTVNVFVVSRTGLEEAWKSYPKEKSVGKKITGEVSVSKETLEEFKEKIKTKEDVDAVLKKISSADTTRVFEVILSSVFSLDATDVHVEPQKEGAVVRLRIDGLLYKVTELDQHAYELVLARTKLLSKLKLNVHNSPQDGGFAVFFEEREVEIRTSVLPSEYGESLDLRVLDPKNLLSFEALGMRKDTQAIVEKHLKDPQGLIATTGPTGSGKTTTLYAFILYLKNPEVKIITIEDPIEYRLQGITQTQVDPDKGYTFEAGLHSILRQDPDVVLLGELRGMDSAEVALQASLAGRRVLTTLHTIDSTGIVPRLVDLGAGTAAVSSALSVSIAQRLVRRLCEYCKIEKTPDKVDLDKIKESVENMPKTLLKQELGSGTNKLFIANENGCADCSGTGYKGRIGVFEVFSVDDDVRQKILENPSDLEIREFAIKKGMIEIRQDAVLKILQGRTSIPEVERVLGGLQ